MMLSSKFYSLFQHIRPISYSVPLLKEYDRKAMIKALPRKDEGVQGSGSVDVMSTEQSFVDDVTFNTLFNGVPYKDLPILTVNCSMNNTLFAIAHANGTVIATRSGGTEGFKHTRKGTTVAAQAAAVAIANKAFRYSLKDIRLVVKGLGPGRLASVKSLQLAGMNIVSITDKTPTPRCPLKPRKAKRL